MIDRLSKLVTTERRAATLAALIVLQALCAIFFIGDVVIDFASGGDRGDVHIVIEAMAAVALTAGVLYLMFELRRLLQRMERMEIGLRAARGEMVTIIEGFFEDWALSAAERDVALLLLKGFDNETIASVRGTAKGTVRAQSTSIYAKAGVDGRAQLFSLFLEELLADAKSLQPAQSSDGDGIDVNQPSVERFN